MNFKKYKLEIVSSLILFFLSTLLFSMGASNILDARLYYSHSEAMLYFESLGSEGVSKYIQITLVDLFLYIPAYTWLLFLFSKRALPLRFRGCSFITAFLDVIETSTIFLFLSKRIETFPNWMGYLTCIKWLSATTLGLVLLFNLIQKARAPLHTPPNKKLA